MVVVDVVVQLPLVLVVVEYLGSLVPFVVVWVASELACLEWLLHPLLTQLVVKLARLLGKPFDNP